MRIITGMAKGKRLSSLKGTDIRPTSDMVKETLFNIIGSSIIGSSLLDLFSGTGNIGIEAFSRGAGAVAMVDNSVKARRLIYKNIDLCGFTDYINHKIFYFHTDALYTLDIFNKRQEKFHFIFLDPPYKYKRLYDDMLNRLSSADILYRDGKIIAEHYFKHRLNDYYDSLSLNREKVIGDTSLSFYQR